MDALPAAVAAFRARYRASELPRGYRPGLHLAFTFGLGTAAAVACAAQLESPEPRDWLAVPATFLYANLAEYLGHRFVMHRPVPGLRAVYRRHARQHHRYFTDATMALQDATDLRAVLFPPLLVVFFFGLFGAPLMLALAHFVSADAAWLAFATAWAYYVNYELLHLAYHAPAGWLARHPWLRRLAARHTEHHRPRSMRHRHFNITYPVFDALFGTGARAPLHKR